MYQNHNPWSLANALEENPKKYQTRIYDETAGQEQAHISHKQDQRKSLIRLAFATILNIFIK